MGERGGSADHIATLHDRLADFCLIADLTDTDLLASDALSGEFLACNDSAHTHLGYSIPELLALSPEAIQADPDHDAAGSIIFITIERCDCRCRKQGCAPGKDTTTTEAGLFRNRHVLSSVNCVNQRDLIATRRQLQIKEASVCPCLRLLCLIRRT